MKTPEGYSRLQIGLHWLIAVLIAIQLFAHDAMEAAWRAVTRGLPVEGNGHVVHIVVGLLVLALVLVRVVVRLRHSAPESPPSGRALLDMSAKATHSLLYLLMFAVPLTGMAAWFGGIETAGGIHGLLFAVLMGLVGLHTLGALYHQYVLKDGLLWRMVRAD